MKPAQAVRASEPPTLMRRTPRSVASCSERPDVADQQIDGLWMHAFTTAAMSSGLDAGRVEAIRAGFP